MPILKISIEYIAILKGKFSFAIFLSIQPLTYVKYFVLK